LICILFGGVYDALRLEGGELRMSKDSFAISMVSLQDAKPFLKKYHYLSKLQIQKGVKSGMNYGLYDLDNILAGVCIYTGIPVKELMKGMLGVDMNDSQEGLWELSRLAIRPDVQENEHNITSWFVARTIRLLRREKNVRLILSYADTTFHGGTIYQALGFKYYGLTAKKTDFFYRLEDGTYTKHSRGKVKGYEGEWRDRPRKHRYLKVFDDAIRIQWEEFDYPKQQTVNGV
jgi:hypothetical protein